MPKMLFLTEIGSVEMDIAPEQVAKLFVEMDSEQQANFFNEVAILASKWERAGLEFQLQAITDEDGLSLAGRRVMQGIGDYSHWGLVEK